MHLPRQVFTRPLENVDEHSLRVCERVAVLRLDDRMNKRDPVLGPLAEQLMSLAVEPGFSPSALPRVGSDADQGCDGYERRVIPGDQVGSMCIVGVVVGQKVVGLAPYMSLDVAQQRIFARNIGIDGARVTDECGDLVLFDRAEIDGNIRGTHWRWDRERVSIAPIDSDYVGNALYLPHLDDADRRGHRCQGEHAQRR